MSSSYAIKKLYFLQFCLITVEAANNESSMLIVIDCRFQHYDPRWKNYGVARTLFEGGPVWDNDKRSMDEFCKDIISQAIQTWKIQLWTGSVPKQLKISANQDHMIQVTRTNGISPEPSSCVFNFLWPGPKLSKLFSLQHEDKFYYISPPVLGPCNRGISMVEFVDLYKDANPGAKKVKLVVNVLRRTTMAAFIVFNFHEYNHSLGSYGPSRDKFKCVQICDNDDRYTIDEFCKYALRENVRMMGSGSSLFSLRKSDLFHYQSPPVFSPGNRGALMVDFMNLYRATDPDAISVEIIVNVFRRNKRSCSIL